MAYLRESTPAVWYRTRMQCSAHSRRAHGLEIVWLECCGFPRSTADSQRESIRNRCLLESPPGKHIRGQVGFLLDKFPSELGAFAEFIANDLLHLD